MVVGAGVSRKGAKSQRGWARRVEHEVAKITKGGNGELIAESWRAWRLCALGGFARLAALRAGADADWRFGRGFSQRRKVAKGVGASGLTRRREDHEGWEGGIAC